MRDYSANPEINTKQVSNKGLHKKLGNIEWDSNLPKNNF